MTEMQYDLTIIGALLALLIGNACFYIMASRKSKDAEKKLETLHGAIALFNYGAREEAEQLILESNSGLSASHVKQGAK